MGGYVAGHWLAASRCACVSKGIAGVMAAVPMFLKFCDVILI